MESLRAYNLKLLANILPLHVAEHFLQAQNKKDEVSLFNNINTLELQKMYSESLSSICLIF